MYLKDKIDIIIAGDAELDVDSNGSLRLIQGEEKHTLPKEKVGTIVVEGKKFLSSRVISICEKYRINVAYINGRGKFLGILCYEPAKNVHIRVKQYEAHLNKKKSLKMACQFIKGKVINSFEFLGFEEKEYSEYIRKIDSIDSKESLLGIEGAAAKRYFNIFGGKINNKKFKWNGRNKRPPKDSVNALLSIGYTVLLYDTVSLINLCGLEPCVGFLHDNYYGRPGLACDFLEEFRSAYVDRFILKAINCKEFKEDDFEDVLVGGNSAGIYLSKKGKSKFYPKWSAWYRKEEVVSKRFGIKCDRRRLLEKQIRHFIHYLNGDDREYLPFNFKNM